MQLEREGKEEGVEVGVEGYEVRGSGGGGGHCFGRVDGNLVGCCLGTFG